MKRIMFATIPLVMFAGIGAAHYGTATAYADTCFEPTATGLQQIVCVDLELPACQYEDGNPDGMPCLWTSPRTGIAYYNDGGNYRG
jgi:hypothetical protein